MKRFRLASSLAAVVLGVVLGVVPQLCGAEPAQPKLAQAKPAQPKLSQAETLSREMREVMRRFGDAICRIEADDEHGRLRGTGFFIDADGTLLTSYSVGGASQDIVVAVGEQRYPATRLVADSRAGIAVLKIVAGRPVRFLKFGKSSELAIASLVIAAGYPLDFPLSPSFGPVAGFDIKTHTGSEDRYFATRHIRANLPVQRGQGGSPVLNSRGEAVGVLISTVEENSGIFALPIEAAEKVLHDFRTYGRIRQGWVGLEVQPTGGPVHGSSARILKVREDAPAYAGGVRAGDVLLQVGGCKITNPEDVLNAAFFVTATEPLTVRVSRDGKEIKLNVMPLDPPDGTMPTIERQEPAILGSSDDGKGLNLGK
jgi:serine protease Do